MKGLELCEKYYREAAREELWQHFPDVMPRAAAGLAGEGSECLGFDDEISRDHDFGPSFCIWLTEADYADYGAEMSAFYRSLPGSFDGVPARRVMPTGRDRVGVMTTSSFYRKFTGNAGLPKGDLAWLRIPEHLLAAAVSGRVFEDPSGEFTRIREGYRSFYPEEVRRKKLAARAITMAQAGQYNYPRMLKRGDDGAAMLALSEFLKAAISMAHLLSKRYTPYYKWMFRSLQELPLFEDWYDSLVMMSEHPVNTMNTERIERFCIYVVKLWQQQGLTKSNEAFLDPQGWELYRRLTSEQIRHLPIQEG